MQYGPYPPPPPFPPLPLWLRAASFRCVTHRLPLCFGQIANGGDSRLGVERPVDALAGASDYHQSISPRPGARPITTAVNGQTPADVEDALVRAGARPFVKWAGGKTQIVGDLLALAPTSYEPFVGGGTLLQACRRQGPPNRISGTAHQTILAPHDRRFRIGLGEAASGRPHTPARQTSTPTYGVRCRNSLGGGLGP